jgi:outer membrane murein-binding lipoprotein Lpp
MPPRDPEPDFADELRGDGEEESPMNAKESGVIPAVVVGVILSAVNIWMARSADRSDTTTASLATLTERVSTLSTQVTKLTEQPYATRTDLATVENRVSGIDARLSDLERAQLQRGQR